MRSGLTGTGQKACQLPLHAACWFHSGSYDHRVGAASLQMALAGCLWHLPQVKDLSPPGRDIFFGGIRLSRTRAAFARFASAALMDPDREASLQIPIADCFYRLHVQIAKACHTHLPASFRHACKYLHWQLPLTCCHLLRFALATQPCRLHFEIPIAHSAFSLPLLARLVSLIWTLGLRITGCRIGGLAARPRMPPQS